MRKSSKSLFLTILFACSIITTNISIAADGDDGKSGSWGDIITYMIFSAIITETISFGIKFVCDWFDRESHARKKIESLIRMQEKLKENIATVKKNYYDRKLRKELEKKYVELSIVIARLQKEYLEKFAQNKQPEATS